MAKILKFIEFGKLGKTKGIQGGIRFYGKLEIFESLLQNHQNFLILRLIDGSPVPFKVKEYETTDNPLVFFENIDTPEEARKLVGRPILIDLSKFDIASIKELMNSGGNPSFKGFQIIDLETDQKLEISDVEQYPGQLMAHADGHLIPLIEEFIKDIDINSKIIYMNLPDGLIS